MSILEILIFLAIAFLIFTVPLILVSNIVYIAYKYYRHYRYGEAKPECKSYYPETTGNNLGDDLINNPAFSNLPQNIFHNHFSNDYHSTYGSNDLFD